MSTRVLIADDHSLMRAGLRMLVEKMGFDVVAEAGDGHHALELFRTHRPELVLMDIGMEGMNGIQATKHICHLDPFVKVLIISMYSDRQYAGEALKVGAAGYLLKNSSGEELSTAVRTILNGTMYLSPKIAAVVVQNYLRSSPRGQAAAVYSVLSSREREVLQLLSEGNTTKQIAHLLHLSHKTIEVHRGRITSKLGIYSIASLTKYAIREGLTMIEG